MDESMRLFLHLTALSCLVCMVLATTTSTTTNQTTTTTRTTTVSKEITTTKQTTTPSTASTRAPLFLGANCSDHEDEWCNKTISGDVECSDKNVCECADTHFAVNSTACLPKTELIPNSVTITNITSSSAKVEWKLQLDVGNLSLNFLVSARNDENSSEQYVLCNVTANKTEAQCNGLISGYMYTFLVEVSYPEANRSEKAAIEPAIPGQLTNSSLKAPNVTLRWIASKGRVEHYVVSMTGPLGSTNNKTSNTSGNRTDIQFAGLTAGENYSVVITAYSHEKHSQRMEQKFRTEADVPGPPHGLKVSAVTTTSLRLEWNITSSPNGNITGHTVCYQYKIYQDESGFQTGKCNITGARNNSYEATNLTAGAWYNFSVYTMNDKYNSSIGATVEVRTHWTAPDVVSNLEKFPGNTYIKLTWKRPKQPNGDISGYRVDWDWFNGTATENCSVSLKSNQSNSVNTNNCENSVANRTVEVNQKNMTLTLKNLMPNTEYNISIAAVTVEDGKPWMVTVWTSVAVPDPVTSVKPEVLNATAVKVSWTIPSVNPGPVNYTVIAVDSIKSEETGKSCNVEGYNSSSCIVVGLQEFWVYWFYVSGRSSAGQGNATHSGNVTTYASLPGKIQKYAVTIFNDSECDATKYLFEWEEPSLLDRNYNITEYLFKFTDTGVSCDSCTFIVADPQPYNIMNQRFNKTITGLKPERNYTFMVYPNSNFSSDESNWIRETVALQACAPPEWNPMDVNTVKFTGSSPSSVTLQLKADFYSKTEQGEIREKGLIVVPEKNKDLEGGQISSSDLEGLSNWWNASASKFETDYKFQLEQLEHGGVVQIGADKGCQQHHDLYCNGPLPPEFSFMVAAFACTIYEGKKRCTVSTAFGPYQTKAEPETGNNAAWIIPVAILIVLGVVIGAFAFLWYRGIINPKKWLGSGRRRGSGGSFTHLQLIQRNRPVPLPRYESVLADMHKDTNLQLSDQYDDINTLGQQFAEKYSCDAAKLESNTPKNRWVNILPFDHTRVKLQQIDDDDPTTDYINANYMPGFSHKREYIATQGPLPGTIDDFWRMVWEHNVSIIVMLTQCKEGNRVKCEMYWPDAVREAKQYGDIVVNPTSISCLDKYNISIFEVSSGDQARKVIHFHYLDFPDFSANVEYEHFINFVRTVRSHVPRDMTGPMVIHCSAGVGRTGTFIIIDHLNQYLNSPEFDVNGSVDIFDMVVQLREHRVSMVQTESQYIMIHDSFEIMLEEKKKSMEEAGIQDHPYENQSFDPFPEVLYENVSTSDQRTEL